MVQKETKTDIRPPEYDVIITKDGEEKVLVNSIWIPKVEALLMEEDQHLNPHASKSTAEFKKRAKHYNINLDWRQKNFEMEKKDKLKFDHLATSLNIE